MGISYFTVVWCVIRQTQPWHTSQSEATNTKSVIGSELSGHGPGDDKQAGTVPFNLALLVAAS